MSKRLFRNNYTDFLEWCRKQVGWAKVFVKYFEDNCGSPLFEGRREDYFEALQIIRQNEVLKASLTAEENKYLEKYLIGGGRKEWQKHDYTSGIIFEHWQEICFPNNESPIKKLDSVRLGGTLRLLRIENGFSVRKVAELLCISETTLRAYENGTTTPRLDITYGMSKIYSKSIDEMIDESIIKTGIM